MKKQITIFILMVSFQICKAQNLVPNGDFEQFQTCPAGLGQFELFVSDWINPNTGLSSGTPDYFNACSPTMGVPANVRGWQTAYSGVAYGGIVIARELSNNDYREYMEVPLVTPLVQNSCYHFEMRICLTEDSQYSTDDIGVYFSNTLISGISSVGTLPYTAQILNTPGNSPDTSSWMLVSGEYTAQGNENYLLIGNFKNAANTTTTVVNPTATHPIAYVYIDSVSLSLCSTGLIEPEQNEWLHVYPSNGNDVYEFHFPEMANNSTLFIYDLLGNLVQQVAIPAGSSFVNVDMSRQVSGMYVGTMQSGKWKASVKVRKN